MHLQTPFEKLISALFNFKKRRKMKKEIQGNAPAGAVYGLGFVGAAIYFVSHATSFWVGVLGLLKAMLWPAFLVYDAFKFFAG